MLEFGDSRTTSARERCGKDCWVGLGLIEIGANAAYL